MSLDDVCEILDKIYNELGRLTSAVHRVANKLEENLGPQE